MVYVGKTERVYEIGDRIAEGGEGIIYRIKGDPYNVLKILKEDKRTQTKRNKILAMYQNQPSEDFRQQVAWPIDVAYDEGNFVGYVMPFIQGESISKVYKVLPIEQYANDHILFERINIAKNLCAAVEAVHNNTYLIGDLNNKNILINVDSKSKEPRHVTLIDADSFHLQIGDRLYRCEVGQSYYLPKELQGINLKTSRLPTFTKESDLFALAVHIFALLMNGWHPFSCAILSTVQESIDKPNSDDNIRNGFFPFYHHKDNFTIPPQAPSFEVLPKDIQALFIKAFVDGYNDPLQRPDAEIWYNALQKMQTPNERKLLASRIKRDFARRQDREEDRREVEKERTVREAERRRQEEAERRRQEEAERRRQEEAERLIWEENHRQEETEHSRKTNKHSWFGTLLLWMSIIFVGIPAAIVLVENGSNVNKVVNSIFEPRTVRYISAWSYKSTYFMTWSEAENYCRNLREGGHSDWRLPDIDELRTLIRNCSNSTVNGTCGVGEKYNCLSNSCWYPKGSCYCDRDTSGYYSKYGDTGYFWSSSENSADPNFAWGVNFNRGGVDSYYKWSNEYGQARCVR